VIVLKFPTAPPPSPPNTTAILLLDTVHAKIVNVTLEEEACAYCLVHVAVGIDHGKVDGTQTQTACACQKSGGGSLPVPLLPEIMATALAASISSCGLLQEQFAKQSKCDNWYSSLTSL
jgi:hypothetical protein